VTIEADTGSVLNTRSPSGRPVATTSPHRRRQARGLGGGEDAAYGPTANGELVASPSPSENSQQTPCDGTRRSRPSSTCAGTRHTNSTADVRSIARAKDPKTRP